MRRGINALLALLLAAGLVAGAVWVRGRIDGSDGGGSQGDGARPRIACVSELRKLCAGLRGDARVVVEPAGVTAKRLTAAADAAGAGIAAWVTLSPWPAIVDEARERAGTPGLLGDEVALARSPIVFAVRADRAAVLARRCGASWGWVCLGDVAGRPWKQLGGKDTWQTVRLAHASPQTSASGLALLGSAVAARLGLPLSELSKDSLDEVDGAREWFTRLEGEGVPRGSFDPASGSPFTEWVETGAAAFDVVAGLRSEIEPGLRRGAPRGAQLVVARPAGTVAVVVVEVTGAPGARQAVELMRRLAPDSASLETAGPSVGIPPAGFLDWLRGQWSEVDR